MRLKLSDNAVTAAVVCLTCAFLYRMPRAMGIDGWDETLYLYSAAFTTRSSFLVHQSWGPLYSLWYRGLTLICSDPLSRYVLSWRLLVLILLALPLLLKISGARLYAVMLIALPVLITAPYVSLFAAAVFLPGICFFLLHPERPLSDACSVAGILSFIVAFARPEFGYGVFFCAAALVLTLGLELSNVQGRSAAKRSAPAKLLVICCLLPAMYAVQSYSASDRRSAIAFVQHFNLRAQRHGLLQPGEDAYRSDYAARAFGLTSSDKLGQNAFSFGQYILGNPRLFLRHVLANFIDGRTVLLLFLLAAFVAAPWLNDKDRRLRAASVFLVCLSVPPLAGILVVFPRDHYAMILVPSLVLYALQLAWQREWLHPSPVRVVILGFLLLCCVAFSFYRLRGFGDRRAELTRIECVRAVDNTLGGQDAMVIDPQFQFAPYVTPVHRAVAAQDISGWTAFTTTAAAVHPLWIASDPEIANVFQTTPQEMDRFLRSALGYVPHACPADAWGLVLYTREQGAR